MRVLVVEDERELAGMLVRGLDEDGFRVDTALDGPTAIRKATESDFDALVLDVMLPVGILFVLPGITALLPHATAESVNRSCRSMRARQC